MANLIETEVFDSGIYRIETSDPVIGGETGIANKAAKGLANRTKWLKAAIDAINITLSGLKSAATKIASVSYLSGAVPLWDGIYSRQQVDDKIIALSAHPILAVGYYHIGDIAAGLNIFNIVFTEPLTTDQYVVMLTPISESSDNNQSGYFSVNTKNTTGFTISVREPGNMVQNYGLDYAIIAK